jgi:hypothetical protein
MNLPDFQVLIGQELHDDLKPYVEESSFGQMLRHPLVYQVPLGITGYANLYYEQKLKDVKEALDGKKYQTYVWLHERPYRIEAFSEIEHLLDDKEYWKLLGEIWVDTENAWANLKLWKKFFNSKRAFREYLMDEEEQSLYKSLGDIETVYRGCQKGINEDGISWTLKKDKAQWFATRFGKEGKVLEMRINKEKIVAVFTGRNEYEVVIL